MKKYLTKQNIIIAITTLIILIAVGGDFLLSSREDNLGAVNFVGGSNYTLAGSGMSSSDTSFTLTSFTVPQSGALINDSDVSDTFYMTIEPGSKTRQEFVSCTTVTQNSGGTATISGCERGLSPISPYTASTSLQFGHPGGASVIISNPPQFYTQFPAKANDETITGQWTFSTFPVTPSSSVATATTTGSVELATGAEAASSTERGDVVSSFLALWTGISTSTPPSTGKNVIPVTNDAGKLPWSWFPSLFDNDHVTGNSSSTYSVYTTTGDFTVPSNFEFIQVEVVGGGGGGGGEGAGDAGSGGGGGGYSKEILYPSDLSGTSSIRYTVGAGGAGGSVTTDGSAGGTTKFSSFLQATGGGGGYTNVQNGENAPGGSGSGGDLNVVGGDGGAASTGITISGGGGSSVLGGGGGSALNTGGSSGNLYGGGGAGGSNGSGGTGADGVVIVQVFY